MGQGRHPIHEAMSRGHEFVPNDTFCNAASSFHIITGVNMVWMRKKGLGWGLGTRIHT